MNRFVFNSSIKALSILSVPLLCSVQVLVADYSSEKRDREHWITAVAAQHFSMRIKTEDVSALGSWPILISYSLSMEFANSSCQLKYGRM